MPNVDEAFPSKYLRADDLKGRKILVTIDQITTETVGQGADAQPKLVLYFRGKDKGMVLNKTNALMLSDILGSKNTDHWHGRQIVLVSTRTTFQGRPVMAIRVEEAPRNAAPARSSPPPTPAPEPVAPGEFQASDDDVPF